MEEENWWGVVNLKNKCIDRLEAENQALRQRVQELEEKYETKGICGYIHYKEFPENYCKHVLLAKERKIRIEQIEKLVAACANCPFPLHDYVTQDQWEQICEIASRLEGRKER